MARKPKVAPVADAPQAAVGAELPFMDDAPAPARRGRKPKAVAATPELITEAGSGNTATNAVSADAADTDVGDAPTRERRGRKPKQRTDDASTSLLQDDDAQEQPQTEAHQTEAHQTEAASEPAPAESDPLIAEMAFPIGDAESSGTPLGDIDPSSSTDRAVPPSPGVETAARAKPAARWDQATDTVQFDWPEIERTASRDGPNQAMAKLLIAARAEGANSRWPL